jgi:hypothetical protein
MRKSRNDPRASLRVLSAFLVVLAASEARAQDTTVQAKALFNAGAQAYEAGQYPAAIQALTEAYRLAPRPGILFSMAQAHRKQYYVDKQPGHLREAVKLYREYVAKVEQGGRRGDAVQALAELDPLYEKLGGDAGAAPAPPPDRKPATRISVSAQAKDATVLLDGHAVEAGIFHDVKPGKHTVRVTAPGYFPEEREVPTAEGGIVAVDVPMREQPGLLTVTALEGADIAIDGRSAATTPLSRPIELTPGSHFVAVTKRGYRAFAQDIDLGRGEAKTLPVRLDVTGQRVASYALLGLAAAGIAAGGALTGVAIYVQSQAQALDTHRTTKGGLSTDDLARYQSDVGTRNDLRTAAGVAFAGGAAVGLTAVFLAVFDQPVVSATARRDDRSKPAAPAPRERPMEVSAAPLVGPGLYGAAVGARF